MTRTKTPGSEVPSDRPAEKAGTTPDAIVDHCRERVGSTLPPLPPNLQRMLDETPWAILIAVSLGAFIDPPNQDLENSLLEQAARACAKDPDLAQYALTYAYLYRGKPWADEVIQTAKMNLRAEEEAPKTLH